MLSPRQCLQLPLLISVVTLTLSACGVAAKSHTPDTFFWKASDSFGPSSTLHGHETEQLIRFYGSDIQRKHRFMLEIAAGSLVSNLEASVNVNGIELPMLPSNTPLAQKLWTYESGDECNDKYVYFYRLKWRVPLFGEQTRRIPDGSQTYEVAVDGFKDLVWYALGRPLPNTMEKYKSLPISLHGPKGSVKLRNQLVPTTSLRIEDIKLDPSSADKDKFVLQKPPLPVVLNCGEEIAFEIKWKAPAGDYDPGNDYDDTTTVHIYYASTPDEGKTWKPVAEPYAIPVQTFPTLFQYPEP